MNITPADLVRGAMTLKDEAALLDMNLATAAGSPLSYGVQNLTARRDALKRCADYLEMQAMALQAVAA